VSALLQPVHAPIRAPLEALVVVVPAHNEQDRIGACIAGIQRAAGHPEMSRVPVHLVVVLDACHDATGWRAAAALAEPSAPAMSLSAIIVSVAVRNVGGARAFGAAQAFLRVGGVDPEAVWLATTDADSVAPANWLAHQVDLRRGGADGVAGTVVVDSWSEHPASTEMAFDALYRPRGLVEFGHSHVHGTNLGVSMAAYLEAGGFSPLATGEDHALWQALAGAGRPLVATPGAPVTTSGRRHGRSPAGFADTLVRLGSITA
jgi:glycosyltransferase involved in cell wall biosynthesis